MSLPYHPKYPTQFFISPAASHVGIVAVAALSLSLLFQCFSDSHLRKKSLAPLDKGFVLNHRQSQADIPSGP